MSSCRACAERRTHIARNPDTCMKPLCITHRERSQERERPQVTVVLSRGTHEELKAMAKEDGLSMSRCVDLMIHHEWRDRQRPPGWGS